MGVLGGLATGMKYHVSIKEASFTIGLNPPEYDLIVSFDLAGRMIGAYVRDGTENENNYRRGYDNRIVRIVKDPTLRNRWIHELSPNDRDVLLERCFGVVGEALREGDLGEAERTLVARAAANGPPALAAQREQFLGIYGSVPILPPDQYRALVLQATRGCPFNDCEFCSFYRGCRFHVNSPAEFEAHIEAVKAFFGESLRLRHSIFLGDANAVLIPTSRLLAHMEIARTRLDVAPADLPASREVAWKREHPFGLIGFYGFLDGLSGTRKTSEDYRAVAAAGLRRVYIGAESGCDDVLIRVRKPCRREQVVETVTLCKEAGVAIGLILLAGVCEDDAGLAGQHVEQSCGLINGLPLDAADIVYLSPFIVDRGRTAALPPFVEDQLERLEQGIRRRSGGPRIVVYDIRGFLY